jgi:guanosine-3',5'-bis(diphosphate) 3'-pyrophosphohydrolase
MLGSSDLPLFLSAIAFAAAKHRDQRRKDIHASPYINHPIEVACILAAEGGITDITVLCAAVLHDTLEDTETTCDELILNFGNEVCGVVLEVTDNKALSKEMRKALQVMKASHSSYPAKLVKLADKIANLRDLQRSRPQGWSDERVQAYFGWSQAVVAGIRGTHLGLEAAFDQAYARCPVRPELPPVRKP